MGGILSPLPELGDSLNLDGLGLGTSASSGSPNLASGTTTPSISSSAISAIGNGAQMLGKGALSAGLSLFGINAQAVTVVAGLILIAGGIFLFKPVQQVIMGGARAAGRAARTAAVTA